MNLGFITEKFVHEKEIKPVIYKAVLNEICELILVTNSNLLTTRPEFKQCNLITVSDSILKKNKYNPQIHSYGTKAEGEH